MPSPLYFAADNLLWTIHVHMQNDKIASLELLFLIMDHFNLSMDK